MHNYPNERYGQWAGDPQGDPYDPTKCAKTVSSGPFGIVSRQCSRPAGHGDRKLFCKVHGRQHPTKENSNG